MIKYSGFHKKDLGLFDITQLGILKLTGLTPSLNTVPINEKD